MTGGTGTDGGGQPAPAARWYKASVRVRVFGYEPDNDDDSGELLGGVGAHAEAPNLATAVQMITPQLNERWNRFAGAAAIADIPVDLTLPTERRRERRESLRRAWEMAKSAFAVAWLVTVALVVLRALVR